MKDAFPAWLAEVLEERRWTYRQAAERFGVTQTSVIHYLNGTTLPGAPTQEAIARALGASVDVIRTMVWESDKRRRAARRGRWQDRLARRRSAGSTAPPSRTRWLGSLGGTGKIIGDIVAPVSESGDWEALSGPGREAPS